MAEAAPRRGRAGTIRQAHYAARRPGCTAPKACSPRPRRSGPAGRAHPLRGGRAARAVEQRLVELKGATSNGRTPAQADDELGQIAEQIAAAEEQGELLAAQTEEHSGNLPNFEDACASRATGQRAAQRGRAGAAADPAARRREPQHRRAAPPVQCAPRAPRRTSSSCRARRRGASPAGASPPPRNPKAGRCAPARAAGAGAGARRGAPPGQQDQSMPRPASWPTCRRAGSAARPAGQGADRGQAQALAGPARPGRPAGPVDQVHIEAGWENALESGAARAPPWNALAGRVETVRAFADDARRWWPSTPPPQGGHPNTHQTLPRQAWAAASERRRPEGAAPTTGWKASTPPPASTRRSPQHGKLTHGECRGDPGPPIEPVCRGLLRADSGAGRHAGAPRKSRTWKAGACQALIADEAQRPGAEAEPPTSQRLDAPVRREVPPRRRRAHAPAAGGAAALSSWPSRPARAASSSTSSPGSKSSPARA